jgi:hypothetical protein
VELCNDLNVNANKKTRYDRLDVAQKVVNIKSVLKKTNNKSEAARVSGVPRRTARYWLDREGKTGLSPEVELFFESPPGMAFPTSIIHRRSIYYYPIKSMWCGHIGQVFAFKSVG